MEGIRARLDLDPMLDAGIIRYTELFEKLRETVSINDRLVQLGYGSFTDGKFSLREDLQKMENDLIDSITRFREEGATCVETASRLADAAEASGATFDETTFVIYAVYPSSGEQKLYIGETSFTCAKRWSSHPRGCPLLEKAIWGCGKDGWICRPILILPGDSRSKELLLYFEDRIQRALETVGTQWGLNAHIGSGAFGGAVDEEAWLENYIGTIKFGLSNGEFPSQHSKDTYERKLGKWVSRQRTDRASMSTHRAKSLEALKHWSWRANASPVTTAQKIDTLLEDPVVIETNGWKLPKWAVKWTNNMRNSYADREGSHVMTLEDRKRIERHLPCLSMNGNEARFRYNATSFANNFIHPITGEVSYPRYVENGDVYSWYTNLRHGYIDLTEDRVKFIEKLGIGEILTSLETHAKRTEVAEIKSKNSRKFIDDRSERRKETRLAKRRSVRDGILWNAPR